jgi:hypothetical protein
VAFSFYQPRPRLDIFASPWSYLASFLGITAGLVIMSANTEEAAFLEDLGVKPSPLFLGLVAVALGIYAFEFR